MKTFNLVFVSSALSSLLFLSSAAAQVTDYGGYTEKFKGAGDKIPPRCQIGMPKSATAPFQIRWHCTDDNAAEDEIRTELFMYRKGQQFSETVASFLGFPAAAWIDEKLLGVEQFEDGMPVSFRLLARDRAGIAMISPYITIRTKDVSVTKCSLEVETEGTESTGDQIGIPATNLVLQNVNVTSQQIGESGLTVSTVTKASAEPCDVEELCADDGRLTFNSTLAIDSEGLATGTVAVNPGELTVEVTGTGSLSDGALETLTVTGETTIDSVPANVTMTCSGSGSSSDADDTDDTEETDETDSDSEDPEATE